MIAEISSSIWEQLATAGLPAVLMAIAIHWLVKSNQEQRDSNRQLLEQLSAERNDRMDAMEAHIERCESHIKECDADRQNLRLELVKLAQQRTQASA